jgi:hypothetical protein
MWALLGDIVDNLKLQRILSRAHSRLDLSLTSFVQLFTEHIRGVKRKELLLLFIFFLWICSLERLASRLLHAHNDLYSRECCESIKS